MLISKGEVTYQGRILCHSIPWRMLSSHTLWIGQLPQGHLVLASIHRLHSSHSHFLNNALISHCHIFMHYYTMFTDFCIMLSNYFQVMYHLLFIHTPPFFNCKSGLLWQGCDSFSTFGHIFIAFLETLIDIHSKPHIASICIYLLI